MKTKSKLFLILALLASLAIFAGCSLQEYSDEPTGVDVITADIQKALQEQPAQEDGTRWNGNEHESLAKFACKMLGITNSTIWLNADYPDIFKDSNNVGSQKYYGDGKPGHCYFMRLDGSKWKHTTPGGHKRWGDWNFNDIINKAYQNFRDNTNNHDTYLGYALHYMADAGVPYHNYWGDSNSLFNLASGIARLVIFIQRFQPAGNIYRIADGCIIISISITDISYKNRPRIYAAIIGTSGNTSVYLFEIYNSGCPAIHI